MSRHKMIRNLDLANEGYGDDDRDDHYFGHSVDDDQEVAMSPGTAQFLYRRQRLTSSNSGGAIVENEQVDDAVIEENDDASASGNRDDISQMQHNPMFTIDDDDPDTSGDTIVPAAGMDAQNLPHLGGPMPSPSSSSPTPSNPEFKRPPQCMSPPLTSSSSPRLYKGRLSAPAGHPPHRPTNVHLERLKIGELTPNSAKNKRTDSTSPSRRSSATKPAVITPSSSSHRLAQMVQTSAAAAPAASTPKIRRRPAGSKPLINLVVVGHVDAGKSTMMGHVLFLLGNVDQRTMHKYRQESQRTGKASFAYAWVLDETDEERTRGVTMDIARASFETANRRVALLDAPGHKDFIPNMITGAAQADAGLLVVNATTGEFETGFDQGGQTREHAMLLRSVGVSQIAVAVNQLDKCNWSKNRFEDVKNQLSTFLRKQTGFNAKFVPISGLNGDNLISKPAADHPLSSWYNGPTLIEVIDSFTPPERLEDRPLRFVVFDVFKGNLAGLSITGKVECGAVQTGDRAMVVPNGDMVTVKLQADDGGDVCYAGEQCVLTLNGPLEMVVGPGHVICPPDNGALIPATRFLVRLVLLNVVMPVIRGAKAELHAHNLCEPCTVTKLVSSINKADGTVLKKRPRCLTKNMSGDVEIAMERMVCLEPSSVCKPLSRFTLRANGHTIAAGMVEKVL